MFIIQRNTLWHKWFTLYKKAQRIGLKKYLMALESDRRQLEICVFAICKVAKKWYEVDDYSTLEECKAIIDRIHYKCPGCAIYASNNECNRMCPFVTPSNSCSPITCHTKYSYYDQFRSSVTWNEPVSYIEDHREALLDLFFDIYKDELRAYGKHTETKESI